MMRWAWTNIFILTEIKLEFQWFLNLPLLFKYLKKKLLAKVS